MSTSRRLSLLLALLLLFGQWPGPALPPAAEAATDDTPTPLAYGQLTEFLLSNGLLYWAVYCPGGEFTGPGYLSRTPAGGGTTTVLATTTAEECETFYAMAAAAEGLYYYSYAAQAILFRPVGSPFDPPTTLLGSLPGAEAPTLGTHLTIMGDAIYWGSYDLGTSTAKIHRLTKDGTDHQILYSGGGVPTDVMATLDNVFYLEAGGLFDVPVCDAPPCGRTQLATTGGQKLHFELGPTFTGFRLYWTDYASNPDRIMRAACNWLIIISGGTAISCNPAASVYTAADNSWYIGQARTAGSNLFWTERQAGAGPTDGRIRRMVSTGGTVGDILTNARTLDTGLFMDNLYVYFAVEADDPSGLQAGLYRLPQDASLITRDLRADWFEVTQGIQNRGNTVPLTAAKTTYVRGYGLQASGPATAMVGAVLHGSRDGSPLPGSPLTPLNGTRSMVAGGSYDRGDLDDGWLFQLPASWLSGQVAFRLEVDPQHAYPDPNLGNNSAAQTLTFVGKAPVCNVFLPVRTNAPTPSTGDPNFGAFIDMATRLWPTRAFWSYYQTNDVAELEACWWGPFPYPCYGPYELPDDTWKVLLSLNTRDAFTDDPDECDDAGGYTHYVGMVHPSTDTGTTNGAAYYDRSAVWVKLPPHSPTTSPDFDFPQKGGTLGHELGHNAGRKHVDCGGPDDPDGSYPYPLDQIAAVGQNSYYGFDVRTHTVLAPDDVADLMGYCQPRWPSDYTWRAFFAWLDAGAASTAAADSTLAAAAGAVYVGGGIAPSGTTGTLNYAYVYPTALMSQGMLTEWSRLAAETVRAAAVDATYQVRVRNAAGTVLATQTVVPLVAPDAPAGSNQAFLATFAAPAGNAAKLELLRDGTPIATLTMGPAVPAVTVSKPVAGSTVDDLLRVEWQAADADTADVLQYTLQYSPDDGATWLSLANDYGYPGTGTKVFELAQPDIPATAGPNQGRIRVLASDGYNTGVGTSAGFTVPNRIPHTYIVAPEPGQTFAADEPITLRGLAFDAEDGALEGLSLVWGLGTIPFGAGAENTYIGVPPGEYPLVLAGIDSVGAMGIATTTLSIAPLGVPRTNTPLLDGYCTDAAYADAVEIPLIAYAAGQQATVRLLRDEYNLWGCFSNLAPGAASPGAFVALTVDPDLSRDAWAQSTDYGFTVAENGGVATLQGDGGGGFVMVPLGGFQAQVATLADRWSAELRIPRDLVGGWDHLVGLAAGHYNVTAVNNNYLWPLFAAGAKPDTWARTALGDLPQVTGLAPDTVAAGGPTFNLTVQGHGFTAAAVVVWDGTDLATTFVSESELTAQVPSGEIATAGTYLVTVRAAAGSPLVANSLPVVVAAATPNLTQLTPNQCTAGRAAFTLAVVGTGFTPDSTVLWGGKELPTTFVSATRLNAQVPAKDVADGCVAEVAVHSGGPDGGHMSNVLAFTVQVESTPQLELYLPHVEK